MLAAGWSYGSPRNGWSHGSPGWSYGSPYSGSSTDSPMTTA